MDKYEVIVEVPASTANLGPGFDTIGMAFQLYTTIKLKHAAETKFHLIGENQQGLPTGKDNLIYQAMEFFCEKAGLTTPEVEAEVASDIPLTRGLGSSASAIVGGMASVNALLGNPLTIDDVFQIASEMEGHPDNVGPSVFGGIVVAAKNREGKYSYVTIDPPASLNVVVTIPQYELSTKLARNVLPNEYSKEDTVHAISHASLLVGALMKGDVSLLWDAMDDRIHQPYRASLMPGLEEILANARKYGALGVALSGAGPTIIAFTEGESEQLTSYIQSVLGKHEIAADIKELPIDRKGVQIKMNQQNGSFVK